MNSLIKKMKTGEKDTILDCLSHPGAIYRMNAISFASIFKIEDKEIVNRIKELKKDTTSLDGYSVSDFALAALDLMGIENYKENNTVVKNLIDSKFMFLV